MFLLLHSVITKHLRAQVLKGLDELDFTYFVCMHEQGVMLERLGDLLRRPFALIEQKATEQQAPHINCVLFAGELMKQFCQADNAPEFELSADQSELSITIPAKRIGIVEHRCSTTSSFVTRLDGTATKLTFHGLTTKEEKKENPAPKVQFPPSTPPFPPHNCFLSITSSTF